MQSELFSVRNGVRQWGVLSPMLFNLYINALSISLARMPIGCCSDDTVVNHLIYADDIVLISPSAKGLQRLLGVTCACIYLFILDPEGPMIQQIPKVVGVQIICYCSHVSDVTLARQTDRFVAVPISS